MLRNEDEIGTEEYKWFKTYDIGDIVGIQGNRLQDHVQEEISVHVHELVLLTKSIQVLPDKWSGLRTRI